MCGIAGWLGSLPDAREHAARMAELLRHRGPDSFGIRDYGDATLIHTRLSIIDLTSAGGQPIGNEDGSIWTVFNGEIYNHRELRRFLEQRGHVFRGRSDSEVIPHLYEEEGTAFVKRLRGMFALAVYDRTRRALVLARDRFGIKPLFYARKNDRLVFASEIRALLDVPDIDTRLDRQAIYDFAALMYIPAPATAFAGVRAVMPGEMLEARMDGDRIRYETTQYHNWVLNRDPNITFSQAVDHADELLRAAVSRQVESDVPLGALLSGGIDSSLVCAAAQSVWGGKLQTFNVQFCDEEYDETWAAQATARHIGSRHRTLRMESGKGTWESVTELMLHAGQPFADTSIFAVNAVCRLMRHHVTVALSGDGGDEGFSGYGIYWRLARIARYQHIPPPFWLGAAAVLAPLKSLGIVPKHWPARLASLAGADDTAVIQSLFSLMPQNEHNQLCNARDLLPVRRLFERQWKHYIPAHSSRIERLSALATEVNVRLTLANDFLFKVDTASMKESLEVRVPMLDEDLFEFGMSLPYPLNVKGRVCKRVLRTVAQRKLPGQIATKPKQGFGIPIDSWVDADFRAHLRETLLGPASRLNDFFLPEYYRPRIEAFCNARSYEGAPREVLYQLAIMLLAVQLTLESRPAATAVCTTAPRLAS